MDSRPASIASSRRSRVNQAFILLRARGLATKLIQSRLGPACGLLFVTTSMTSPLFNLVSSGTKRPLTFAPTVLLPISV